MALALCLTLLPTAVMAEDRNTIYTQSTYTGADSDGTKNKPFKTFDAALSKAKGLGGHSTIVILGKAYQNDNTSTSAPLIIDTPVTIEGRTEQDTEGSATFRIRSGGIVLGANVTIENVELSFENWMHNAIFVNGHQFTATNVTRASGSREVHLFGGELKDITTATSGPAAVLTLTNSIFGNIYAGSMSQYSDTTAAAYNGNTTVSLTNCTVGSIYGSGARAAHDPDNFIGTNEPDPPTPRKDHTVSGPVAISLDGKSTVGTAPTITVNGNGTKDVSVTISNASDNKPLHLTGVSSLTVNGGTAAVTAIDSGAAVTLNNNATINLYAVASANNAATIASLSGSGTVAIGKEAALTIGAVEGQHILKTVDSSGIQSRAVFGQPYIIQNNGSGSFTLDAGSKINPDMELTWDADGKTWKTPDVQSKTYLEELKIDPASKNITKTVDEINHETPGGAEIKVLIGKNDALQNVPLTFTVNGQKATTDDDSYVVGNMRLTAIDEWDNQSTSGVATISIGKKDNDSTIAAGTYNFTVTAPTANNSPVSDTFTLTVTDGSVPPQPPVPAKNLTGIAITTPPTKTAYTVGDTFDPTGMVVTAHYSGGSTAEVSGYTTSPTGLLTTNDTSITVSYTENGVTKTTTQTITVKPKDPTVAPGAVVTISGAPATAVYGDSFTLTAAAANAGTNGAWTWTSSNPAVLEITGSGSSVTVKVLKASTAPVTITATYTSGEKNISATTSDIHVTHRAITVRADNKSMTVGGTLPALTVSCGNFASGDTADMVFATQAVASTTADGKTAGSFPITVTAPTLKDGWADRYEIGTPVSGTLTVRAQSSGGSSSDRDNSGSTGKVETTTKPDGTKVQTETKKDGTKVEITTAKDGSTSKTTTNPNGSSVTENKAADGSTGTVKTDKNGQTTAETALSSKAIEDAKKNGEAVKAPVEVKASRNSNTAPTVKVELPKGTGETKVEIPVSNATPGTVAVLVHADGTEEIVKNSLPTEDGIQLTVNGGATVKIVDNSKDFADTRNHWAKDAIDFVSARGLVSGMSGTTYAPDASTTRAQLWTILARQNNADLTGGATWFENAQNWAKEKGISDGTNPNGTINRAQMVTMLWRAMGQPTAGGGASFADVPADSYYAQAVAWAIENDITAGVGGGRFDPNSTCTRGQIATFLYRYMK